MKKYLLKFSLAALLIITGSCEDFLDVNQDPNVIGDNDIYSPKVILPSAQMSVANNLMGWDFGFGGGYWSEYWTQAYAASQFKTLCEYNQISFGYAHNDMMSGALMDLAKIKELSTADSDQGYYYVAEVLSIFSFQLLTDVWGNVPYFEALNGAENNLNPVFDDGEAIYTDLLTRVNALLTIDPTAYEIDGDADFIYAGNMSDWESFAKSLKLKLMIRLSETPGYDNAAALSFIEANTLLTNSAKVGGDVWDDTKEGKRHPMREFEEGGAAYLSTNVIGCKTFIDYLNINLDPRIDVLFTAPAGGHKGAFFGDFDSKEDSDGNGTDDDEEDYSKALFAGDIDLMLMSDWEINFYIAEVYARNGDEANAKMYYDMAVTASLAQNGITDLAILTGYAAWVNTGDIEANIKQIAMQKWVANANYQHIESFLERNRTHYPAVNDIDIAADRNFAFLNFPLGDLTLSVTGRARTNDRVPAAPFYDQDLLNLNTNAPSQKADLLQKVWWNTRTTK